MFTSVFPEETGHVYVQQRFAGVRKAISDGEQKQNLPAHYSKLKKYCPLVETCIANMCGLN